MPYSMGLTDIYPGTSPVFEVAGAKTPTVDNTNVDSSDDVEILASNTLLARNHAIILNSSSGDTVYIGPAGVTTATGFPLEAGKSIAWVSQAACYAICAAAESSTIHIIDFEA